MRPLVVRLDVLSANFVSPDLQSALIINDQFSCRAKRFIALISFILSLLGRDFFKGIYLRSGNGELFCWLHGSGRRRLGLQLEGTSS